MPSHKSESVINLDTLIGGLNTYELPYRLGVNETPDIANLLWRDGALGGRPSQAWLCAQPIGGGYTCFDGVYYGYEFYHIGDTIYAATGVPETRTAVFSGASSHTIDPLGFTRILGVSDPTAVFDGNVVTLSGDGDVTVEYLAVPFLPVCRLTEMYPGCPMSRGVFLRYQDDLIYKARGVFVRISYRDGTFSASDVSEDAYVPVTYINAKASSGTGDNYQPENRLSPKKTIWYNAGTSVAVERVTIPSGGGKSVTLKAKNAVRVAEVYIKGESSVEGIDWTYDRAANAITFLGEFSVSTAAVAHVEVATDKYYLPLKDVESVSVEARLTETGGIVPLVQSTAVLTAEPKSWSTSWDGDFVFWPKTGLVLFKSPPYVAVPEALNTVRITYSKENPVAFDAVMSCKYAVVYGGDTNLCMVLGGSEAQPNVFYWNGNNISMDITYWPMESYNLAGDNSEPITGFGKQQNLLIIFKENSVSKATLGTQTVNGRLYISMDTVGINSRIGCDLPYSIQLIDNNLVFCNSQGGIHVLLDTSAANENNIRGISRKVNGTPSRDGILKKVQRVGAARCSSFDDNSRYWLVVGDEVYVWDYVLSSYKDPSFFYLTNIPAISFVGGERETHYLHGDGRITALGDFSAVDSAFSPFDNTDYGMAIPKRYSTPVLFFGDGDFLKDVNNVIFTVSSNTWSRMQITYKTDCETRRDYTDAFYLYHRFAPRNLQARCLSPKTYSATIRRKPGCRHIRYFSMLIESAEPGMDMSIVSAQIFWRRQGRDR
jgi:hypothetical protein